MRIPPEVDYVAAVIEGEWPDYESMFNDGTDRGSKLAELILTPMVFEKNGLRVTKKDKVTS
jgi:hypothetical protein